MAPFVKFLDFQPVNDRGEKTFKILSPGRFTKMAEEESISPKIRNFISTLKPTLNKIFALVNALGATEYWGSNINGDAFYEDTLKQFHNTFVEKGKPFMHHQNTDKDKFYGKVLASDYNNKMHRVELVIEYDTEALDKKTVNKLNEGQVVSVSMGCRVPYDVCSICGNRAKSPENYCGHLKGSPGLGRMMPDGRKAFAINTEPEFFDISIVTVPADPTARILMKIANVRTVTPSYVRTKELGIKVAESVTQPFSTQEKLKELEIKEMQRNMDPLLSDLTTQFNRSLGPDIPRKMLNSIGDSGNSIFSILKGFIDNKVFLRPQEIQRMALMSTGNGRLADEFESQKLMFENEPGSFLDKIMGAPSCGCCSSIPDSIISSREMEPENIKRIVIRITLPDSMKTASLVEVPVSEDFRILSGDTSITESMPKTPSVFQDPLGALKAALTVGSLVTAFNTLLGRELTPGLMSNSWLYGGLLGPMFTNMMRDVDRRVNKPVERMVFKDRNSPEAVEAALQDAMMKALTKTSSVKKSGVDPLTLKGLMSLPLAYGASKIMEAESKKSSMEEAQQTGEYKPGWFSSPAFNFPIALATLLKFSHAKKDVNNFVKQAERHLKKSFASVYHQNKEAVERTIYQFLFQKC